jgi:uncharacterized protein
MTSIAMHLPGDEETVRAGLVYPATASGDPHGLLVFAHGAGAGQTHPFMVSFATGFAARGLDVVTFNFPYMEARRRTPDRAPVLEDAFRRAVAAAVAHPRVRGRRLFIGGKSMGGRMAVRAAAAPGDWPAALPAIDGVIVFGYPLKPPGGATTQDRTSHFETLAVPVLIVQGTRDSFGGPDDIRRAAPKAAVHAVEGGDHSFNVPKSARVDQASVFAGVTDAVMTWIAGHTRHP